MIKTSAMFSAHAVHVLLRNTLILFIVIFTTLFFWLQSGITAEKLTLGHYEINGLYIKLDKKLTLKTENITIPKSKSTPSFKNIDKTFDNIKYLFTFFDYIELEKIHFNNNQLKVVFADNILYITSDDYEIAGNIERVEKKFIADISLLYLKKDNINIVGELTYDPKNEKLDTKGKFNAYNIKGDFNATKEGDAVVFAIKSKPFSDLRTLIDKFSLKSSIKSWIIDKVKADKYTLHYLSGRGKIDDSGFKVDFKALKGEVLFENVKIFYKEKLAPVLASSLLLNYKNGGLYFDLKDPTYKERDLNGSRVSIEDIVGENPAVLKLNLQIRTEIDSVVQEILKAYRLNIPVSQKGERTKLNIAIDVPLKESSKKISVVVSADIDRSEVTYEKIKLPVLKGHVTYESSKNESIKVIAQLQKGVASIYRTDLPLLSGSIGYSKGVVDLHNVHIKEYWYDGKVNGQINLTKKSADLKFSASEVSIGDKEKFFVLKNKTVPLTLNYGKNVTAWVPSLKLKIIDLPKEMQILVGDIKSIKPYLKNIDLQIDGGKLDIRTKDFKRYTFNGELKRRSCFFYDNENICHAIVPVEGTVYKNNFNFYAFNKRLYFNATKSRMKLKNLNIDLEKFLNSRENFGKRKNKRLVITGQNSQLRYGKHKLVTDSYDIEIKANGNIKAIGSLDGDIVKFNKKGKIFSLRALRVKDKLLHPLIDFKGLQEGRYSLKKSGDPKKTMKGQIIVEGGVMRDFKAYNNTLALLNTIPALATLHSPGFSKKGFKIKEGVINYKMMNGEKIIFDSIYVKGKSATIVGRGELDLVQKTIKMDLAIQIARELGSFIGNIPLVGYILMGKDKSMTIGLKISGTLDKPKVKTSTAEDILTLPLQIIKRTFQSPAHIINK